MTYYSPERPRHLTFERIARTEDTNDAVIEAKFQDSGSFIHAIIVDDESDESVIRVWLVESRRKGDMKLMLDEMCRQLETNRVDFLEPDVGDIENHVQNAERVEEIVDTPGGDKMKSVFLKTHWEYD